MQYRLPLGSSRREWVQPQITKYIPPEVICCVISKVESKSTLCSLAVCSREYYVFTVPLIYGHVELDESELLGREGQDFQPLRKLASLLLRRPDLACLVRHWTMRPDCSTGGGSKRVERAAREVETVDVDRTFTDAVRASSHSSEEENEWLRHISWKDHADSILALILPALVKLEKLDIMLQDDSKYFARMIQRAGVPEKLFDTKPAFQHLREIMHTYHDDKYGMSVDYTAMFLHLPAIRGIYAHRVGSAHRSTNQSLATLAPPSSTLEHLEFKDCKLNDENIVNVLRAPKALHTFIYELGGGHLAYCLPKFAAIRNALTPQQHCLENLWLDYEQRYGYIDYEYMVGGDPMAPFAEFAALKVLRIATIYLFGKVEDDDEADGISCWNRKAKRRLTGLFPMALEKLWLCHAGDHLPAKSTHLFTALQDLITHKVESNPRLREITIEGSISEHKDWWTGIVDLAKRAEAQKVMLTTIELKMDVQFENSAERSWGMDGEVTWADGVIERNKYPQMKVIDIL